MEDRLNHYVIMDFCPRGHLCNVVLEFSKLPEPKAQRYLTDILPGLAYIHSAHNCHRDIKLENILIDAEEHAKLSDFGFGRMIAPDELLTTQCGSLFCPVPETAAERPYDGKQADIWSYGLLFFVMVTGTLPWKHLK
jgi:serine/threonine protein kinase